MLESKCSCRFINGEMLPDPYYFITSTSCSLLMAPLMDLVLTVTTGNIDISTGGDYTFRVRSEAAHWLLIDGNKAQHACTVVCGTRVYIVLLKCFADR